jgi:hypothetical protein
MPQHAREFTAHCPDCGDVELFVWRCPICGGASWTPKGLLLPFDEGLKRRKAFDAAREQEESA